MKEIFYLFAIVVLSVPPLVCFPNMLWANDGKDKANHARDTLEAGTLAAEAGPDMFAYPGEVVYFNGTGSRGAITSYRWDFDDKPDPGDRADEPVGKHTFGSTGKYIVKLRVNGDQKQHDTDHTTVTILPEPADRLPLPFRGLRIDGDERSKGDLLDEDYWISVFKELERLGYNMAVLSKFHPYPFFICIPGFEFANAEVSDEQLARERVQFERILQLGLEYGIRMYFMVYNFHFTQGFADHYGYDRTDSIMTDEVIDYTAAAFRAFHEAFPQFGGMLMTSGEEPGVGSAPFVNRAIFDTVRSMKSQPFIVIRDQCRLPFEMEQMREGLRNYLLMSKLTEHTAAWPTSGYRGKLFRYLLGTRNIYVRQNTSDFLFFGSYRFAQEQCRSVYDDYGAGLLLWSNILPADNDIEWFFREAYGRYMTDPMRDEETEAAYWAGRVKDRFGHGLPADKFLEAADASTWIMPLIRSLIFNRATGYKAEFGLPLISFLGGFPTVSSFVYHGVRRREQEQAFSWWYPREVRNEVDFLTINEFVTGTYQSRARKAMDPLEVADELHRLAGVTLAAIPDLRDFSSPLRDAEYRSTLDLMEFSAWIGHHYATRIRAAIGWKRWQCTQINQSQALDDVVPFLAESVRYYQNARILHEAVYGTKHFQSFLVATENTEPPNWQILIPPAGLEGKITGGMREMENILRYEVKVINEKIRAGQLDTPLFCALQKGAAKKIGNQE